MCSPLRYHLTFALGSETKHSSTASFLLVMAYFSGNFCVKKYSGSLAVRIQKLMWTCLWQKNFSVRFLLIAFNVAFQWIHSLNKVVYLSNQIHLLLTTFLNNIIIMFSFNQLNATLKLQAGNLGMRFKKKNQ